jgi:hypothetical protein
LFAARLRAIQFRPLGGVIFSHQANTRGNLNLGARALGTDQIIRPFTSADACLPATANLFIRFVSVNKHLSQSARTSAGFHKPESGT